MRLGSFKYFYLYIIYTRILSVKSTTSLVSFIHSIRWKIPFIEAPRYRTILISSTEKAIEGRTLR